MSASSPERAKVVLYNPQAVFYTMPLALVAIGSALDEDAFEVEIIDARLEEDSLDRVLEAADGALCLGITALTGAPLTDALRVSRAVKGRFPDLPVVWGGWHPSLFPEETLREPSIDVTVQGQGEETFREIVARLRAAESLEGVAGATVRVGDRIVRGRPRPLVEMDALPAHDYGLIPVERFFAAKGQRQLDYISSAGCPFRCAFCADPFVYQRKWVAVGPERMGEEIEALWRRHRFTELAFQDETFFTYRERVIHIAEQFLARGLDFKWSATMRADQAMRLTDETFALCVRSGFDRAMIGVESGSQEMLDWMQKDIKVEQVIQSAEMCARHGVGAIFPFIVGFPNETEASVRASFEMIKRLRSMSPRFETPVFYFKPYPGSLITAQVVAAGFELPDTIEGWADFDFIGSSGPWVTPEKERFVERFKFYNRFAGGRESWARRPLQRLARWRCRRDAYGWPWEKRLVEWLRPQAELS